MKQCDTLLRNGTSVAFFPEGTRSQDGKMHAFKKVLERGREFLDALRRSDAVTCLEPLL